LASDTDALQLIFKEQSTLSHQLALIR
jgi:hypothetical protein